MIGYIIVGAVCLAVGGALGMIVAALMAAASNGDKLLRQNPPTPKKDKGGNGNDGRNL